MPQVQGSHGGLIQIMALTVYDAKQRVEATAHPNSHREGWADREKGRKCCFLNWPCYVCLRSCRNRSHLRPYLAYRSTRITVICSGIAFLWCCHSGDPRPNLQHESFDDVIPSGDCHVFWRCRGFWLRGLARAGLSKLNFEFLQGYGNFGRLRPLHTSAAVIFAFVAPRCS